MGAVINRGDPDLVLAVELAMIADDADAPDVGMWIRGEILFLCLIGRGLDADAARHTVEGAIELLRAKKAAVDEQRKTRPPD